MQLGEKLRYLREVEGTLRGRGRAMTQLEVVAAVRKETGATISQSYLSQIERGARPHLTNATRTLLARFFRVHPGYLVDDPEGYHTELVSDLRAMEDRLDAWLTSGAERFASDGELREALLEIARSRDSRRCLLLLGEIVATPQLAERLLQVLGPPPAHPAAARRPSEAQAVPPPNLEQPPGGAERRRAASSSRDGEPVEPRRSATQKSAESHGPATRHRVRVARPDGAHKRRRHTP